MTKRPQALTFCYDFHEDWPEVWDEVCRIWTNHLDLTIHYALTQANLYVPWYEREDEND